MMAHDRYLSLWSHAGNLAVQVFFALSGWLIGGILVNTSTKELPRFFFNRCLRIWVPYFVGLALLIFASLLKDNIDSKWMEFVTYKALFVYNLFGTRQLATETSRMPLDGTGSHFWSVNAEEQFYLLAPLVLCVLPSKIGKSLILWVCISAAAWYWNQYASIAIGVLAAVAHSKSTLLFRRFTHPSNLLGTIALCTFGFVVFSSHYFSIAPLFSLAVVLFLATPGKETAFGEIVGGLSYPLYLNHWIGGFIANAIFKRLGMQETLIRCSFAMVLNIFIAFVLYWWIDRKLRMKRGVFFTVNRGKFTTILAYTLMAFGLALGFAWSK